MEKYYFLIWLWFYLKKIYIDDSQYSVLHHYKNAYIRFTICKEEQSLYIICQVAQNGQLIYNIVIYDMLSSKFQFLLL